MNSSRPSGQMGRKRGSSRPFSYALWALVGLLSLWALGVLAFVVISRNLPSVENFENRQVGLSTKIFDRTKTVLLYSPGAEQRTMVPDQNIPKSLKDAIVSIEDENFYTEPAFSWTGMLRALLANLFTGHVVQGGSTITQQLARNAFLTLERTTTRKIKELVLAVQLNRLYSKDQILYFYINEIPYGPNIYGAEAASQSFFGKHVSEINLSESAVLAASLNAPSYYSPWGSHTKELIERQHLVLKKMAELKKITPQQYSDAINYKVTFQEQRNHAIKAPHFVMAVQDYLIKKYGEDIVQKGGLEVVTTLDWDMQQAAEKAVKEGATVTQKEFSARNAALVAEDPQTGQILSMVGSRDYFDLDNEGNFNVATQGIRQPGSSLKPFVYMTAFEKGLTPDTVLFDVPTEFVPSCPALMDPTVKDDKCFHPQNYLNKYRGPISLRYALANSINIPAVKVLYIAGLNNSLTTLHNFGITTLNDPQDLGLSVVLGGGGIKLVDLVGAYSVLAQDGVKHEQSMVLEVKDSHGNTLESFVDQSSRVVDPQYPRLVNDILSDTNARMDLFGELINQTVFPDYDVALKTGTSNDYRDAWTFGYTPNLAVGVWAGNNDNTPMNRASGARTATPIWHNFISEALKKVSPQAFTRPEPTSPSKPILGGQYVNNGQVHTILYYIDKSDPTGPAPQDPSEDPQFHNWETAVSNWINLYMPNIAQTGGFYGQTSSIDKEPPQIIIQNPAAGQNLSGQINLQAQVTSNTGINQIKLYFNNELINNISGDFGTNYIYSYNFTPQNTAPQNLIEIEAVNKNNISSRTGIITY